MTDRKPNADPAIAGRPMRIRHVINTVGASAREDLLEAQRLTLDTIETAISVTSPDVQVEVLGVGFADEELPAPWLVKAPPLERSVLDVGTFSTKRRLPLLQDLLSHFRGDGYDLGVFTNIDIALQPMFYDLLREIRLQGYDAFTINRRTVHPRYAGNGRAWFHAQTGTPHPGHDCFVFTPSVISRANVGEVCVGVPLVGRALLYNLRLEAAAYREFTNLIATFHVGDDRPWRRSSNEEYTTHNIRAMGKVLQDLIDRFGEEAVQRVSAPAGDIARTLSADPPRWRPKTRPKPLMRPRSFDRQRIVFAASPGRSGTMYLARLLDTASNSFASHESKPTMTGPFLRAVAYADPSESYQARRMKVDTIIATLRNLPANALLADTSHMFIKTFADVVCDAFNHDRITVLNLQRPLPALITSMAELGWFTAHAPAWRDWLIPPTAPNSLFPIPPDQITGRLDSATGYVLDSIIRTRNLRWSTPEIDWIDIDVDRLVDDRRAVESLFNRLRLTPTAETWQESTLKVNHKSNTKVKRSVRLPTGAVDRHLSSFRTRFAAQIHELGVDDVF